MLKLKDRVRVLRIPKSSIEFSFEKLSLVDKCVEIVGVRWDSVFNEWFYGVDDKRLKVVQWFRGKYLYLIEEEKMSGFKVGDLVRVVRKVEYENGWVNTWTSDMDPAINGNVQEIDYIDKSGVKFVNQFDVNEYRFHFPVSSLELVSVFDTPNIKNLSNLKLKTGDKVKVVRRIDSESGWRNGWIPEMDTAIGNVFTVDTISPFGVYFEKDFEKDWDKFWSLGFPIGSLELVYTKPTSNKIVSTNYQYLNGAKLGSGGPLSDLCLTILTTITKYPDGSAKVDWSVAFKHPKDKFNKELARNAVSLRETKELFLKKGFNRNEIVLKILSDMLYHDARLSSDYKAFVLFLVAQYSTNILRKAIYK